MKHLEFIEEMRIDNFTFLFLVPSLGVWEALLFNSMSVFRACVEFGAVFYGFGGSKGGLEGASVWQRRGFQ